MKPRPSEIPRVSVRLEEIQGPICLRDADEIEEMMDRLKEDGLLHPVILRRVVDRAALSEWYEVEDGRLRIAAASRLGWEAIRAIVIPSRFNRGASRRLTEIMSSFEEGRLDDFHLAEMGMEMRDCYDVSPSELADLLHRSRGYVCNLVRWYETLPEEILTAWKAHHPAIKHILLEECSKVDGARALEIWKAEMDGKTRRARSHRVRMLSRRQIVDLMTRVQKSSSKSKTLIVSLLRHVLGLERNPPEIQ